MIPNNISRKTSLKSLRTVEATKIEWDPNSKEPWHFEFEKEPVNDKKWSCIVTAAVPTEVQDQEYIQKYNQCVSLGLRRAIRIITIADVIKLLKGNNDSRNNLKEKPVKNVKNKKPPEQDVAIKSESTLKPPTSPFSQIVDLAAKYAELTDKECNLPPDLMAAVVKYLILSLKDENCLQKKIDAAKERKIRERNVKAKFIRNLKPYEMSEVVKVSSKSAENIFDLKEPINDEPIDGPDLYVLLVDFYDLYVFPELRRINVPFLAILEFSTVATSGTVKESSTFSQKSETFSRRKSLILSFWEKYKLECSNSEEVGNYKNIAALKYQLTVKSVESNVNFLRVMFDEISWTLYSVYCIYRQHQKYLQELHVQRLIKSLQPLNLSSCVVYNKLCDALITGEPITPLLVLYAIIEQVVAGVPETDSVALEYRPRPTDFFSDGSEDLENFKNRKKQPVTLVTPCLQCRDKKCEDICERLKEDVSRSSDSLEHGEWSPILDECNESSTPFQNKNLTPSEEETNSLSVEYIIPESLLDQALSERQTEKDFRNKKKWKTPSLGFFGDSIFLQTRHCEPRFFDTETIVERFLKNTELPRIWAKYPEPPPGDGAFYNFHFNFLKQVSNKSEEVLKLYIYFTMSMKLIGITKSFMYRGDEEDLSDVLGTKDKTEKLSKVKFSKDVLNFTYFKKDFNSYFHETFIQKVITSRKVEPKKQILKIDSGNVYRSTMKTDLRQLHNASSQFLVPSSRQRSNGLYLSTYLKQTTKHHSNSLTSQQDGERELTILHALLDCLEISNLAQPHLIFDKENFAKLVQNFIFYEKFEPYVMIQRLFEAQDDFNTTQCSYFPPTDTIIVILYNEYDHRGISFSATSNALPTPVHFRDFYSHVYNDITQWLVEEVEEWKKFVRELQEKAKAEAEKKDLEYLANLKKYYCGLSEEERKIFLETDLENVEPEVREKELEDLPVKPKPPYPDKLSFVVTNFMDSRVEFSQKIHEFNSPDGTEVNVKIENWLYAPSSLLRVRIKRSNFQLYYNQWLEQEIETSFTFKTVSDIIFSFYKSRPEEEEEEDEEEEEEEEEDRFNYHVTISWPTGLLIQPIPLDSTIYVKQSYLKTYRKGWNIENETSRCYVRNGQVVIFKECGGYDILCPSGTKYTFFESAATPKYEIISTTGEVWEVQTKGRCKNRKNLLAIMKVFIGTDTKAQEIFYKREDGVYCMLWSNAKLVTTYPDGTKITTMPDFDENEVSVEWTEEERLLLKDIQSKLKSEQSTDKIPSRSVIRNNSSFSERKSRDDGDDEKFVSVSCSYLAEHPKYSSVFFNREESNIRLTMPEGISMCLCPGGNYVIQKESVFLRVCGADIEFCRECPECKKHTTVKFFLNENEILCKCEDFFDKVFLLHRSGKTVFQENDKTSGNERTSESKAGEKATSELCVNSHYKSTPLAQRCFAFERDLSGVEFLHKDSIAIYSDALPENTFFDLNTDDPSNLCHTFTSPYYKVGYENWVMEYEEKDDSLPTNLKKKDLKEIGVKEVTRKTFKYPFPAGYTCGDQQHFSHEKSKENVEMPKVIIARTIRSWPGNPQSVIDELQKSIADYQKRASDIWKRYKNYKVVDYCPQDSKNVMMRLRKIALTLNQSLQMYPHLCTQFPSTEKEIHYFGHFINSMNEMKSHFQDSDGLPDCKQLPLALPRSSDFPSVNEESDSLDST